MALAALLALLVLSDVAHLRMLYGFALAFGVGDAFYFPARGSLVPRLLPPSSLLMGNAIVEGSNQFAMFAGPILAGMLIAAFDRPVGAASASSLRGLGFAFAVDAATFVFSGLFVWLMRTRGAGSATTLRQVRTSLWRSVVDGLAIAKADPFIRSTFLLVGLGNFLITGPLYVGLPVLAHTRFAGGAGDLGLVLSLFGLGSVTGVVVAAVGARSSVRPPVVALFFCPLTLGVGLTLLGFVHRAGTASPIVAIMGVAQGYLVLQFITFVQTRTAPALLGRVISLLTFLVVGLSPLSSALAGALLGVSVTRLFAGAGAALVGVVVAAFLTPAVRSSFRSTAGPKQTDVTADGL